MKKVIRFLFLLVFSLFILVACASSKKEIKFSLANIEGESSFISEFNKENEFSFWKKENTSYHINDKAQEYLTIDLLGNSYDCKYTGNSYVKRPNIFVTDEYEYRNEDNIRHVFLVNSDSKQWVEYESRSKKKEREIKSETEILNIAREISDNYIDRDLYDEEIHYIEGTYIYSINYTQQIEGIPLHNNIKIMLYSDGELNCIINNTSSVFNSWLSNKNKATDFIKKCSSDGVYEELENRIKKLIPDGYTYTEYKEKNREIILVDEGKIAILYQIEVGYFDTRSDSDYSYHMLCDYIVYM